MFKYQLRNSNLFKNLNKIPIFKYPNNFVHNGKNFFSKIFKTDFPFLKNTNVNNNENKFLLNALIKMPCRTFSLSVKSKRKLKVPNLKLRIKNHRGLMKRLIIVGPRWDRQFKFKPVGTGHKSLNKSRANLRRKRQLRFISPADIKRVKKLIPYFKRKKYQH